MKTLYIAGPMSNIPQFNFPLFEAVARALRADGWTIVSPHETDHEDTRRQAWESQDGSYMTGTETWGDCLARDVKMLADGVNGLTIDGIAFLPNWSRSRGARLEAFVGLLTGKEFFEVTGTAVDRIGLDARPKDWVQNTLALGWRTP